jgi:hypothetical protein
MATEVSTIGMVYLAAGGLYRKFDRRRLFPMLAEGAPSLRCHPSLVRPDTCIRPMLGYTVARERITLRRVSMMKSAHETEVRRFAT